MSIRQNLAMQKAHVSIRATAEPHIVELEMTVPAEAQLRTSIESLLSRHGARCAHTYFVSTSLRKIMRTKIEFVGSEPVPTLKLALLLEDLSTHHADDSSPRAA